MTDVKKLQKIVDDFITEWGLDRQQKKLSLGNPVVEVAPSRTQQNGLSTTVLGMNCAYFRIAPDLLENDNLATSAVLLEANIYMDYLEETIKAQQLSIQMCRDLSDLKKHMPVWLKITQAVAALFVGEELEERVDNYMRSGIKEGEREVSLDALKPRNAYAGFVFESIGKIAPIVELLKYDPRVNDEQFGIMVHFAVIKCLHSHSDKIVVMNTRFNEILTAYNGYWSRSDSHRYYSVKNREASYEQYSINGGIQEAARKIQQGYSTKSINCLCFL